MQINNHVPNLKHLQTAHLKAYLDLLIRFMTKVVMIPCIPKLQGWLVPATSYKRRLQKSHVDVTWWRTHLIKFDARGVQISAVCLFWFGSSLKPGKVVYSRRISCSEDPFQPGKWRLIVALGKRRKQISHVHIGWRVASLLFDRNCVWKLLIWSCFLACIYQEMSLGEW